MYIQHQLASTAPEMNL